MLREHTDSSELTKDKIKAEAGAVDEFDIIPAEAEVQPEDDAEADPLLHSLEYLQPSDIELSKPERVLTMSDKIYNAVRSAVFVVSLAVFVVCLYLLAQNLIDKKRGADIYNQMASGFDAQDFALGDAALDDDSDDEIIAAGSGVAAAKKSRKSQTSSDFATALENSGAVKQEEIADEGSGNVSYDATLEKMKAQLNQLKQINPDIYGWIYVEGTNINYALVQYTDNDYYLNHSTTGENLVVGAIFVDFRNNREILKNFNTVIYGHNVTDGSMFHDVTKFTDPDTFNNTNIYIYTFDGAYIYKPFAIYQSRYDYNYFRTSFSSTQEFVDFAEEMHANSQIPNDTTFKDTDRMITLSTCTNTLQSMRYALQAKLIKIIN